MQKEHPDQLVDQKTKWLYLFIGLAALLNFSGLFVTIMGPDGALYASIAKHMVQDNNYSDLFSQGKDWLDKPHFPFWVTAVFFKVFGITTWAYKLPGVLFVLLAAMYTYRLAKDLYNKEIGLWAALILLTSQHIIICTMDVRAEPYLTGLIIAAVYHFHRSLEKKWLLHLLIACLFAACAVMTKGIFALIPVGGAVAGELLITKNWKMIFNFRWILALIIILLFITPEIYSLYSQFDLHPEKTVFGQHHVSGIKFFFWDSQFGRFFNTGPIKKSGGDPSFFLHTILWAYLPWSLLLYASVLQFFRKNVKKPAQAEWYSICGSLLTFLVFSVSKFQLPFYIVIVFPFFSILCAQWLYHIQLESTVKAVRITQAVIASVMVLAILLLQYFFRPANLTVFSGLLLILPIALFIVVSRNGNLGRFKILFQVSAVVFFVNLYFNLCYYPRLLKYQGDSEAAFWINANNPEHLPVVQTRIGFGFALDFYTEASVFYSWPGERSLLPKKPYLLYADTDLINQFISQGLKVKRLQTFDTYRISRLKGKFLNHVTRHETLAKTEVVLVN
jgi:4-amino-4-deoxy-L-arabinose transferase-like glycosyltransferase